MRRKILINLAEPLKLNGLVKEANPIHNKTLTSTTSIENIGNYKDNLKPFLDKRYKVFLESGTVNPLNTRMLTLSTHLHQFIDVLKYVEYWCNYSVQANSPSSHRVFQLIDSDQVSLTLIHMQVVLMNYFALSRRARRKKLHAVLQFMLRGSSRKKAMQRENRRVTVKKTPSL